MFSSQSSEWITPKELYDILNKVYKFDLDPCTTKDNPLGTKYYYTKETDGLCTIWPEDVTNVFINPPYNKEIGLWLYKAKFECYRNPKIKHIVFLLPARTDTKWFHKYIYLNNKVQTTFLPGRLKFRGAKNSAPFPSMIVVFSK